MTPSLKGKSTISLFFLNMVWVPVPVQLNDFGFTTLIQKLIHKKKQ